jgi:hypothetical protein
LNRDLFIKACSDAAANRKIHDKDIQTLGVVRFRELDDQERVNGWDNWVAPSGKVSKDRLQKGRWKTIVLTVVDDAGQTILTDADIPSLQALPSHVVSKMAEVAFACCGLSDEDIDEMIKKKSNNSDETTDESAN